MGKGRGSLEPSNAISSVFIYVVDDHRPMCNSIEALLSSHGFTVECFTKASQFIEQLDDLASGIVLLDLRMPEMSGHEVLAAMKGQLLHFPVIMMTGHGEIEDAVKAIKAGAKNFIQKPFREDFLLDAIITEQQSLLDRVANEREPAGLDSLSPRERDVVLALAKGQPNKVIAHELGISVRTVEMHRSRAMSRLGCRTFADLLRAIFSSPELDPSSPQKATSTN